MELKELASKLGVKNIVITHINNYHYKDYMTIVVNDDLVINLVGKTFSFIPLNSNGINKGISNKNTRDIFNEIRKELVGETI